MRDEEEAEDDRDLDNIPFRELPPDHWQPSQDGTMRTRTHNIPRKRLYVPEPTADVSVHLFKDERMTDIRRGAPNPEHLRIRDNWKADYSNRCGLEPLDLMNQNGKMMTKTALWPLPQPQDQSSGPSSAARPAAAAPGSTPTANMETLEEGLPEIPATLASLMEPEPVAEPQVVPSLTGSHLPVPEGQAPYFHPARKETFAEQRARLERQETLP